MLLVTMAHEMNAIDEQVLLQQRMDWYAPEEFTSFIKLCEWREMGIVLLVYVLCTRQRPIKRPYINFWNTL